MASFDGQSFSLEPEESGRVITKLNELIEHAENLVKQCDELKHIKGIAKFKKRCLAELNFVQQVRQDLWLIGRASLAQLFKIKLD